MRNKNLHTINKYGKQITLPPQTGNTGVQRITSILDECSVPYETEYRIDADGCRRCPFDIALIRKGRPVLFVEYDGTDHFNSSFFEKTGVRPERCTAHIVKTAIGEAKKTAIAAKFGIPVVRINELHMENLRDRILALVEVFVNEVDIKQGNEVIMVDMLDRYGFDFPYIPPSDMSKKEKDRIERLYKERKIPMGSTINK